MNLKDIVLENPVLAIMRGIPTEILSDYVGAVIEGGVNFFEVALNSPDALNQIAFLRKRFGDRALIGAGTAITTQRAKAAVDAGAQFLLSPSTNEDVLSFCHENGVMLMPGALTPTDVSLCVRYGFNTIKLFPAGDMPMSYVKSLKGPFDDTDYVAIGGVNGGNAQNFIKAGYIGIGLGTNLIAKKTVEERNFTEGSRQVAELLAKVKGTKAI